ncbi:MAG: glutamate racemase [Desulfobacter sp.]|nr:MAG: glutamate racemase [Desulfobacter sp.]
MIKSNPIGVFDSGVGGLSICHAIKEILPGEHITYFADIHFSPYGNKPGPLINKRSEYIAEFLINRGCKAIVVACNTATVTSIQRLRSKFLIPIVGVEPGIKPASLKSNNGIIGVLATAQTLDSDSFKSLKARFSKQIKIEVQACPEFVDLVEHLNHNSEKAERIATKYIHPLLVKGCDQIVLGCTHFSFLKQAIEKVSSGRADIIDTAVPVAKELKRRLYESNRHNESEAHGMMEFWTSGLSSQIEHRINRLWGTDSIVYEAPQPGKAPENLGDSSAR